uniref:Aminotransferase-like plant mobile domain-containing protein n=1 Tax=Oryza punctata TaxID=4537 RepID=A0A0E0L1R3_ORYPU
MAEYLQEKANKARFHTVITTGNVRRSHVLAACAKIKLDSTSYVSTFYLKDRVPNAWSGEILGWRSLQHLVESWGDNKIYVLDLDLLNADMEEEWPYPLLSKDIDARHRAKKISDGNSCSTLPVLIPRTAGWWGIDPRWKPRQKRQADNKYRRSMHLRMTPWIEAWSQALNDVIHETRAYDHNTYEQYMAWYSSQTRIRLLAPEDPDEGFQFLTPLLGSIQTNIAGELVREAKTLWEKLRDGIAGTNQEVMAAVDSLRRKVRSTSVREAPTIPTIPEITQMSACLGGFDPTQEGTRMVRPVPQMPHPRPHMIPQMMPDVPTSHWQGGFALFAGTSQGFPTIPRVDEEFFGQGGFTSLGGSFRPEIMAGFRPYASSYGDMSRFGGGSSSVPNELWASQTDDAPQMTQPTQPDDGDFQGNIHDPRRSNRERHEPTRLSLSGPRHATGRRKKTASKRGDTSRTMTEHDEE